MSFQTFLFTCILVHNVDEWFAQRQRESQTGNGLPGEGYNQKRMVTSSDE